MANFVVGAVVACVIGADVWYLFRRKKKGKGGCSCGGSCSDCGGSCCH